ncbi:MAG: hypothetical protein JOZ24_12525 [Candidatus Eremiobacteraeota bacterium]|nr:hypothetical protein [Candidatus Eremiobacteraeota bacterium]
MGEGLRRLHVDTLVMRADRAEVAVGDVFHLTIRAHVREAVAALDELVVPDVGTMQLEGDERRVTHGPSGTDVIETLTLEPRVAGAYTFPGAYVDAIDARTGRPSRFTTNPVRVVIDPPPLFRTRGYWDSARFIGAIALFGTGAIAGAALLATLAARIARRERLSTPPAPAVPPPPAAAEPSSPRERVAEALRAYRAAPHDGALVGLRTALFAAAGASEGATLRDALASTGDHALRTSLIAAERAVFGPEESRGAAALETADAAEAWLR